MTDKEMAHVAKLAKAVKALPVEKQFYVLGYAEGVADAMKEDEHERNSGEQSGSDPTEQSDP